MRRVLAVLLAASFLVVACGRGQSAPSETVLPPSTEPPLTSTTVASTTTPRPTTTEATDRQPMTGGSVVIADDQEPPVINPFVPGGDNSSVTIVAQAHMAGAYDIDASSRELIPELVVELPTVENGGVVVNGDGTMTVSWNIRDEAVWSDGVPIGGDDFAFTVEYREAVAACWEGEESEPEPFVLGGVIDTVDDKTISIRFDRPSFAYETIFRWVVPEHAVSGTDYCNDWNDTTWPAAGPFVITEWQRGEHIKLQRNPNYWKIAPETGDPLPYLDNVELRFIPETEEIVSAFGAREVDVIQPPPAFETAATLQALDGVDVQVLQGPVWEHFNFQFGRNNRNEGSVNESRAFRQAVAHAIDRNLLVREVYSGLLPGPIEGFLEIMIPEASSDPWSVYDHNPERAIALVAAACEELERDCEAEPPVVVFSTTSDGDIRVRIGDLLRDMLAKSGIEVELDLEDSQLFFGETLEEGTFDFGLWAWVGGAGAARLVSIFDLFDPDAPPPDGRNFYRWGTPDSRVRDEEAVDTFRTVLAELRQSYDHTEVMRLAGVLELILAEEAVIIPLVSRIVLGAYWADEIAGFEMNATRASHTWNIEFWRRIDL